MKTKRFAFSLLLAMLVASSIPLAIVKAHPTTISVSPATKNVQVGDLFTVDVVLDYAENLYAYEFWLSFDKNKLTAMGINYTNYLNEPYHIFYQEVNNAGGFITLAVSSTYPALAKTGGSPPPLANITFMATNPGDSTLHLYDTIFSDNQGKPISHATVDGTVHITGIGVHDVAVTNVTTSKDGCVPMPTIPDDTFLNVSATVLNKGDFSETFDVILYANTTVLDTKTVTALAPAAQTTVDFTWNTNGWAHGNNTISAYAVPVQDETSTGDNTFINGMICVVIPGDINGDGTVNILDAIVLGNSFLATPSSSNWNPNADINDDNVVNILDAIILANHFLQHYP